MSECEVSYFQASKFKWWVFGSGVRCDLGAVEITKSGLGHFNISRFDWSNCYYKGRSSRESPFSRCGPSAVLVAIMTEKVEQQCNIWLFTRSASRFRWEAAVQECCWRGLEARGVENGKLLLSNRIVHFPYLSWDIPGSGWISAEIRMIDDSCAATETALVSESKLYLRYSPPLVFPRLRREGDASLIVGIKLKPSVYILCVLPMEVLGLGLTCVHLVKKIEPYVSGETVLDLAHA